VGIRLNRIVCMLSGMVSVVAVQAQSVQLKPSKYTNFLVSRLDVRYGTDVHTGIRDYLRKDVFDFARALDTLGDELDWRMQRDVRYLLDDNDDWLAWDQKNMAERPVLKYFYRTKAHFFETKHPDFQITVDPLLNFQYGSIAGEGKHFVNQRGVAMRGHVDRKVFFYTDVVESQIRVPDYVRVRAQRDKSLPGAALYKAYRSDIFNIKKNGYDYLDATAYIGFHLSRHIGLQLGHGTNFIGDGYRSLLLSDHTSKYFYLKVNWQVWKLHYQNIFAQLFPVSHRSSGHDQLLPRKYAAFHYLSFKPDRRLEFGFFEGVVFKRSAHFELQYLNPIILYRTVEHLVGSPDNEVAGLTAKWNFLRQFQLYGQVAFDEFKLDELFRNKQGWWGNKYGIQAGARWVDAFKIPDLDVGVEFNRVMPYTYSHSDSLTAYTHNNQYLAHPLGANFAEWIVSATYRPHPRWMVQTRAFTIRGGEDKEGKNWGANPLHPNVTRVQDYGNFLGQGHAYRRLLLDAGLAYQIMHNGWVEVDYFLRRNQYLGETPSRTQVLSLGFRLNLDPVKYEF